MILQVVPLEWQRHPISSRHTTICLLLYTSRIEGLITSRNVLYTKLSHLTFLFLPPVESGQFFVLFLHVLSFVEASVSPVLTTGKPSQPSFYSISVFWLDHMYDALSWLDQPKLLYLNGGTHAPKAYSSSRQLSRNGKAPPTHSIDPYATNATLPRLAESLERKQSENRRMYLGLQLRLRLVLERLGGGGSETIQFWGRPDRWMQRNLVASTTSSGLNVDLGDPRSPIPRSPSRLSKNNSEQAKYQRYSRHHRYHRPTIINSVVRSCKMAITDFDYVAGGKPSPR